MKAFEAAEEEMPIAGEWAPERRAKEVLLEWWRDRIALVVEVGPVVEEISRVERVVPPEIVAGAFETIGAGPREHVDLSARATAKGRVGIRLITRNSRIASVDMRLGDALPKSAAPPPRETPPSAPRSSLKPLPSSVKEFATERDPENDGLLFPPPAAPGARTASRWKLPPFKGNSRTRF
jgi:hypothetical protein